MWWIRLMRWIWAALGYRIHRISHIYRAISAGEAGSCGLGHFGDVCGGRGGNRRGSGREVRTRWRIDGRNGIREARLK